MLRFLARWAAVTTALAIMLSGIGLALVLLIAGASSAMGHLFGDSRWLQPITAALVIVIVVGFLAAIEIKDESE